MVVGTRTSIILLVFRITSLILELTPRDFLIFIMVASVMYLYIYIYIYIFFFFFFSVTKGSNELQYNCFCFDFDSLSCMPYIFVAMKSRQLNTV